MCWWSNGVTAGGARGVRSLPPGSAGCRSRDAGREPDPFPTVGDRSADKDQAHGHGRSRSAPPAAAPALNRDALAGHPLRPLPLRYKGGLNP